jgi:phi13 family phage major tail protein
MAAGKVITGFSKPYVAVYSNTGDAVTYANGQVLARGVEVEISPEVSDSNNFYADNIAAETAAGIFTGGELTLTVDGLFQAAERLIMGIGAPGEDGFIAYTEDSTPPFVGVGFVIRWMSDGVTSYQPVVLPKVAFAPMTISAATQEDEIDWQTTELTGSIFRDDTTGRSWQYSGGDETSEAAAEAKIKTKLGIA